MITPITYFLGADGRWRFTDGRKSYPIIQGGAVTASGKFINTWKKPHDGSDLVLDYINDVVKCALFNNSITPNFSTDASYGVGTYASNEITGTGYAAGGVTLGGKTVTESPTLSIMYDANDLTWTTATWTGARCGLYWDDTATSPVDCVVALQTFGADYAVTAGTFTVQQPSTGIWADKIA